MNKQGGGREGEISKKNAENNDFAQKFTTFLHHKEKDDIFLENIFFLGQEGDKIKNFLKSSYWVV